MMVYFPIAVVLTVAISMGSATGIDPCTNHMVLHDVNGLRSNHSLPGNSPLCDRDIATGWYRVDSPAGEDMFNRCPELETCSTIFPVWMDGNVPPDDNQIHSRTAYVRMGDVCDAMNIGIQVKNCSSYTVYHLTNTPGCPMAYCFGHKAPCPPDSQSLTGWEPYCETGPLFLNQTPTVDFTVQKRQGVVGKQVDKQVVFRCDLPDLASIREQHEDIILLVRWFIDGSQHVTAEKEVPWQDMPHELHEEDWSPGGSRKFGITFRCAVRLRLGTAYSSPRESDAFFAGFVVDPQVLHLMEGETDVISVVPTVPVLSASSYYRLQLEVIIPSKPITGCNVEGWETANLVAGDRCGIEIQSIDSQDYEDSFREITNNPATMNITATVNGIRDFPPSRLMQVRMKSDGTFLHFVWANVTLPSVLIHIRDKEQDVMGAATCWSNDDPHMTTFDGCQYENHRHGEFILYRHKTLPIQVNTFYKPCGEGSIPSCNCAVAVKSGADVFIVDVCPKPVSSNPRRIGFWSCLDHSLVVEQNGYGNYIITLPTGGVVFIRWIYGTGISSVSVMASVLDYGLTEGLCGNYNGDHNDDFIHQGSNRTHPDLCPPFSFFNSRETDEFSRSWS